MDDLSHAIRFYQNFQESNEYLQRIVSSSPEPIESVDNVESVDSIELAEYAALADTTSSDDNTKDGKMIVSGLYEYKPPSGLNVKLVRNERSLPQQQQPKTTATKKNLVQSKITGHTIFLKSEPVNDNLSTEGSEYEEVYDADIFDEYEEADIDSDLWITHDDHEKMTESENSNNGTTIEVAIDADDSKMMQIKPVRTNKVRLGCKSANKGKSITNSTTRSRSTAISKENAANTRSAQKSKPIAVAHKEPKQPKKCEICGNTYMYQHALER